jgi:hypothetical protein
MYYGLNGNTTPPEHMHCTYCGQELAPDAEMCYRCGRNSPFQLLPIYNSFVYIADIEVCEITWGRKVVGLGITTLVFFQAELHSPDGKYIIATSEPAPGKLLTYSPIGSTNRQYKRVYKSPQDTPEVTAVFSQLVNGLMEDGWQYKDQGVFWWNQRFQRPLESQAEQLEQPESNETRRLPGR